MVDLKKIFEEINCGFGSAVQKQVFRSNWVRVISVKYKVYQWCTKVISVFNIK